MTSFGPPVEPPARPEARVLSVSELTQVLNVCLEQTVGAVDFEGEIGELSRPASGHVYATLKDGQSQISIVLWASTVRTLSFTPAAGLHVRCRGRANIYHKSGRFQMVVTRMEPAGEGALQKKFLELKAKLEREGLFATERKRPLPFLPKAIGLVTSASGAVVHDIMVRLKERMPQIPVYLVDVRVQGPGAAEEIVKGIERFNDSGIVDVMIVGRGGGSLEDLWAFNEEIVVRAIFRSKIPVISAVGHEVDISLADFVADVRAPTPTAAAEVVVPRRADLLERITQLEKYLLNYEQWLGPMSQSCDELSARLVRAGSNLLSDRRLRLSAAEAHLRLLEPGRVVTVLMERVENSATRLRQAFALMCERSSQRYQALGDEMARALERLLEKEGRRLELLESRLTSASPLTVLERGYAVIKRDGRPVTNAAELKRDDTLSILFRDGGVTARVEDKMK